MSCYEYPLWSWRPDDPLGAGHHALVRWLEDSMGIPWRDWWLNRLAELENLRRTASWKKDSLWKLLVQDICRRDVPEMIELLYPVAPEWFLTPIENKGWDCLNALARCARLGSAACVDALLELGADPNGLDSRGTWNWVKDQGVRRPVTPLDCARLERHEDCCLLLEMYGGAETGIMVNQFDKYR